MDKLDYWRLCDELTVEQAAQLILGRDPGAEESPECRPISERPEGYEATKCALMAALKSGQIGGMLRGIDGVEWGHQSGQADPRSSTVVAESLRGWLTQRNFRPAFFFPGECQSERIASRVTIPEYMDPEHPRYPPKLALAVRAWLVSEFHGEKSPKEAMKIWLREAAESWGMVNEDGTPNETAIEEIAKVANWQLSGGAPKTPTERPTPLKIKL